MAHYTLPAITTLPSLPAERRAELLSHLFEPCDALNALITPLPFDGFTAYSDLIALVQNELLRLKDSSSERDQALLLQILSAHPRLGASKVDSAHSRSEQASLGGPTEAAELQRLNDEYEERFPGECHGQRSCSRASTREHVRRQLYCIKYLELNARFHCYFLLISYRRLKSRCCSCSLVGLSFEAFNNGAIVGELIEAQLWGQLSLMVH
ncbi:hypothetical protein Dda_2659 [Drechslerella dactyloides]|uniref:Oxo-4-hydroxy-4-carboxy-5-ureidoimidazoline decarboxylase domain-containing protein n=1 Tax=Drechslerella dactyloides TaxID=74499 RepID=A0AAD6IZZ9_DREDA|nr:hypothetical protein Dda_2659 [Drechslerella dactyloides]